MRRAFPFVLALALSAVSFGCKPDGGSEAVSDIDVRSAFLTALERESNANYTVLYDVDGGDERELRRSRTGERARWDSVLIHADGAVGESTVIRFNSARTCLWAWGSEEHAEVSCWASQMSRWQDLYGFLFDRASADTRMYRLSLRRDRILEADVDCYSVETIHIKGAVCLTDEGAPLQLMVDHYLHGRFDARAVSVSDPLAEEKIIEPVVEDGFMSTFPAMEFPRGDLTLPDLPALEREQDEETPPDNHTRIRAALEAVR